MRVTTTPARLRGRADHCDEVAAAITGTELEEFRLRAEYLRGRADAFRDAAEIVELALELDAAEGTS